MKLKDCELIIGVIVSVEDETHQGRIKCVIPGKVQTEVSDKNSPWVRPLFMAGYQTFSKEMIGSKVWILMNNENYNEYWYFPFFELNNVAITELAETYENDQPEIFMAHDTGGNNAIFMYDEINGYRMMAGQNHMSMTPDGHINIKGSDREIDIEGSIIKLGAEGDGERAVLGEKLSDLLNGLKNAMDKLASDCIEDEHTVKLQGGFQQAVQELGKVTEILSEKVKLN